MRPAGPLIAHRGASVFEPENTLAALDRAADLGCGWVEVDAQVTHDGAVVLMHDHTVDRTTDGTGAVAMMPAAEVLRLRTRAPGTGAPGTVTPGTGAFTDHAPPTLAETIDLCARRGLGLVLEIKATWGIDAEDARAVAKVIPAVPPENLVVTSFSVPALQAFRHARPEIAIGLACLRPPSDPHAAIERLGIAAVHCNTLCTRPEDLARLQKAGTAVAVATINDRDEARRFLALGAHGVMTDDPTLLGTDHDEGQTSRAAASE